MYRKIYQILTSIKTKSLESYVLLKFDDNEYYLSNYISTTSESIGILKEIKKRKW